MADDGTAARSIEPPPDGKQATPGTAPAGSGRELPYLPGASPSQRCPQAAPEEGPKPPAPAGQHLQPSLAWPVLVEVPVSNAGFWRRDSPLHPKSMGVLGIAGRINSGTLPPSHSGFQFHRGGKEVGAPGISRKGLEKSFPGGGERDKAFFFCEEEVFEEEIRQVRRPGGLEGDRGPSRGLAGAEMG